MRIAIDARYLNATPTPLSQYCENLIEHLSQVDTENEYVVFIHQSFPKTLRVGENFKIRQARAAPLSWRTLMRFHKMVERAGAQMLHSLFPLIPLAYRGRLLVTIHDLKPMIPDESLHRHRFVADRWAQAVARWVFPVAVRRAGWLVAVSNATREALCEVFPEAFDKTVVTHSGLDPSFRADLDPGTRDLVLAKYKPPARYLFYCGSVRPGKNMDRMLAAFAQLRRDDDSFSDLHFVIDSPPSRWLEDARKTVRRLGLTDVAHFYTSVAETERRTLYSQAQVFCFPCRNEGFGFPVLEAQASGVPVLAADCGALPETAGAGALLVDPNHVPAIAEGLRRILGDTQLRDDLVEAGRRNALKYSWTKTAKEVRDVYNLLL